MRLLRFITCIAGLALLVACTPTSDPSSAAPQSPPAALIPETRAAASSALATPPPLPAVTGRVQVWYGYGTDTPEAQALQALVAAVQHRFPAAQIDLLGMPPEQLDSHLRAGAPGNAGGPDLVIGPLDSLIGHARAGVVKPLDDARPYLSSPYAPALAAATVTDALYSLPLSWTPTVLYYNRERVAVPPATAEALLTQVRDGNELLVPHPIEDTLGWAIGLGARIADASGACVADEGAVAWLTFLRELRAEPTVTFGPSAATMRVAFQRGEIAMLIDGGEHLAAYQAILGDDLGVAAMPTLGDHHRTVIRVDGIVVNAASVNSFGAQALALHLSRLEAQHTWSMHTGRLPVDASLPSADPLQTHVVAFAADASHRPQLRSPWNLYPRLDPLLIGTGEASAIADDLHDLCATLNEAYP